MVYSKEELLKEDKPIDTSDWTKKDIIRHNNTIIRLTKMSEELLKLVNKEKDNGNGI